MAKCWVYEKYPLPLKTPASFNIAGGAVTD
jgi:hypothetical protein